jgi:hypothetical protein
MFLSAQPTISVSRYRTPSAQAFGRRPGALQLQRRAAAQQIRSLPGMSPGYHLTVLLVLDSGVFNPAFIDSLIPGIEVK